LHHPILLHARCGRIGYSSRRVMAADRECVELDGDVVEGAGAASLLATAIEEGRDLSSMSGILADRSYRLLPA
jgi:hypothetical protein